MASTNKTTNYELSQYVSSDKPTYLVDYNSDMSKIDAGIHTAKTTADGASTAATNAQTTAEGAATVANTAITNAATADTKATTANANIGTLANLTTTEKSNLVSAINEVDSNADIALTNIGTMGNLTTDVTSSLVGAINSIETKVEELDNYALTETDTGKHWVNGKRIYRKCFYIQALPNNTTTSYASGVQVEHLVQLYGAAGNGKPINGVHPSLGAGYSIGAFYDLNTQALKIETTNDFSDRDAYVIIEYTKAND